MVLGSLKSRVFEQCLLNWITSPNEISDGELVAIDGMTEVAPKLRFTWSMEVGIHVSDHPQ